MYETSRVISVRDTRSDYRLPFRESIEDRLSRIPREIHRWRDARVGDIRFVESKDSRMPGTVRFILSRVTAAHFRLLNRRTRDIATLSKGVLFKETRYQYVRRR